MAWNAPDPPKPPGEWFEYSAGMDYSGWVLECPPVFHAHIVSSGGKYTISFNGLALETTSNLKAARARAEAEIVRRVRQMLPAYRVIFARLEARGETGNVTHLRPQGLTHVRQVHSDVLLFGRPRLVELFYQKRGSTRR